MFPQPIQKLIAHFQKLPGIGPRQAAKFALRLVKMTPAEIQTMSQDMINLKDSIGECKECFLLFDKAIPQSNAASLCQFCRDKNRDRAKICVVTSDHDALTIEKTKSFNGVYHILGGHISLLDKKENSSLNLIALKNRLVSKPAGSLEIILALNATTEGQATAMFLERYLQDSNAKISRLAQGLSTGSEIEYTDNQTLINAFKHRR